MSAQRRAGSKRRGTASSRRSGTDDKNVASGIDPVAAGPTAAATVTVNPPAAPAQEKQSRLSMPGRPSRPPMPEQAKPSRPPMPEKPKPASESKNPVVQRFGGLERWYQDTASEMRKIVWPDRETTKNLTIVVIGISIVLGILLGGIDYILQAVFEALP